MTTKEATRIFRPWDDTDKRAVTIVHEKDIEEKQLEWRVPPVDWTGYYDGGAQYWNCLAAAGLYVTSPTNKTKQRPKKFRCPHCDVAFSNNGQLKGHVRIHTGERPYRCEADGCGKSFTRNEELTRHKRIHSGVRPYPCPSCGKSFGRKDHLKKHSRTHQPQIHYQELPPHVLLYPYLYGF